MQRVLPSLGLEAGDDSGGRDEQGALDKHAVAAQQLQHLVLAHGGQFGRQPELAVLHAAGVEETAQGQTAGFPPAAQFLGRGGLLRDVARLEGDAFVLQPFAGLFAGGALGVFDE